MSQVKAFLERWQNFIYGTMAAGLLLMICLIAISQQSEWQDDKKNLPKHLAMDSSNYTSADVLFGCPSLAQGVLLTIDGGPSSTTMPLLNALRQINVKALFFLEPNNLATFANLTSKIVEFGHTLGILVHNEQSYDNWHDTWKTVHASIELITNFTTPNVSSHIFIRPKSSKSPLTDLLKMVKVRGYTIVLWNCAFISAKSSTQDMTVEDFFRSIPHHGGLLKTRETEALMLVKNITEKMNDYSDNIVTFMSPELCFKSTL